ncbi:dnaJ homolog subfamily C member 3-like [Ptychodera flava]|uniref:dnaJ homolog subfamily C member 3-like n=1 Tax=Ptychodera flava TaxID=63121 RepID=UPI00396A1E5F
MLNIYRFFRSLPLLFVTLDIYNEGVEGKASKKDVEQHLELGKQLLAAGQLADALSHYNAAIEGDPENYQSYFRRATVYLAMGKSKFALPDLDKCIKLKPDFTGARSNRASVLLKQGKLDEAKADYKAILDVNPKDEDAKAKFDLIGPLKENILYANQLIEQGQKENAIQYLSVVIEHCPWNIDLRNKRADAYIHSGQPRKAIDDIRPAAKMVPDNTEAFYKLSTLHYSLGDLEESLIAIRDCLKLDPDHKQCFPQYKKAKKLNKQFESAQEFMNQQNYDDAILKLEATLKTETEVPAFRERANQKICTCLSKNKDAERALVVCSEILENDENNLDALCDRAEAYIANEQYEEAINDYQRAKDVEDNQRTKEGLERAQKLLKQSKKRDYYKILGVPRNARKREITKAYRKLAQQWHPDNFINEEEKKAAETKFIDIAAAKEVLTDPEMRKRFDSGEDPLDPEQQQQSHQHHWGHFNPFASGGGPFNFKFHF